MSARQVLVFGGDRLHDADAARCERMVGAAGELWPDREARLLLGAGPVAPQEADGAVAELLARWRAEAGTCVAFSSNDRFSIHVARLFCARVGVELTHPVVRVRPDRATCVTRRGERIEQPLAAVRVMLVDDRYFVPRPVRDGSTERIAPNLPGPDAYMDVPVSAGAAPLPEAELVMSAGDGVSDWESFSVVARCLGATVGGSKVVCDKGLLPRDRQVGSSGSAVAPRVYLAFGISGSVQHMQGIADSTRIVAINTDPNATILRRAEVALVTDANALLRHLRAVLEGAPA